MSNLNFLFLKKLKLVVVFTLIIVNLFAQKKNYIPNPSFEIHKNKSNNIKSATPWIGVGTVDYYLKPDKKDTSRYKGARTGKAYAGLRFQVEYKEYMYVPLVTPLEKNRTYHFTMYVRLLGQSTVTVRQLGVYFSDDPFKYGMDFNEEGLVDSTYKKGISGTLDWIPIQGEYLAHGGERYCIIGNFTPKTKEDFVRVHKWNIFEFREAYYFVDDISLYRKKLPTDTTSIKPLEKEVTLALPDSFVVGQVYQINNIQFENASAKLLKSSFKILDELVKDLNNHPLMEIQINGHTDNSGNEAANKKLSKDRAKTVYDYLKLQGVINPMNYKGFGASQPLVPNDTDENKSKNRRVEFVIIKE